MNKLVLWAAPGLLLLIAANQYRLAYTRNLSPWKGGGFGMFSTVDSLGARRGAYFGTVDGKEYELRPNPAFEDALRKVEAMPVQDSLDRLVDQLARDSYAIRLPRPAEGQAVSDLQPDAHSVLVAVPPTGPLSEALRRVTLSQLRAELWRYKFQSEDQSLVKWVALESKLARTP